MAYPVDPKSKPPGILVAQTEEDAGLKRLNYNLRCRDNKQELVRYLKKTMTIANAFEGEGFLLGYKAVKLNDLISLLFIPPDESMQNKIKKIRDVEEMDALILRVKHSSSIDDFISALDQAVDRAEHNKQNGKDRTKLRLDHLLQK